MVPALRQLEPVPAGPYRGTVNARLVPENSSNSISVSGEDRAAHRHEGLLTPGAGLRAIRSIILLARAGSPTVTSSCCPQSRCTRPRKSNTGAHAADFRPTTTFHRCVEWGTGTMGQG